MTASREMPRYRCHKEVWALKIAEIDILDDLSAIITPADAGYAPFQVSAEYVDKRWQGTSADAGYYVVYADGHASWSPSEAFEDGYTRIEL